MEGFAETHGGKGQALLCKDYVCATLAYRKVAQVMAFPRTISPTSTCSPLSSSPSCWNLMIAESPTVSKCPTTPDIWELAVNGYSNPSSAEVPSLWIYEAGSECWWRCQHWRGWRLAGIRVGMSSSTCQWHGWLHASVKEIRVRERVLWWDSDYGGEGEFEMFFIMYHRWREHWFTIISKPLDYAVHGTPWQVRCIGAFVIVFLLLIFYST